MSIILMYIFTNLNFLMIGTTSDTWLVSFYGFGYIFSVPLNIPRQFHACGLVAFDSMTRDISVKVVAGGLVGKNEFDIKMTRTVEYFDTVGWVLGPMLPVPLMKSTSVSLPGKVLLHTVYGKSSWGDLNVKK